MRFLLIAFFLCFLQSCFSKVYIVDQKKTINGKRTGTLQRPFQTIEDCIKTLKNPGDECQIREGRYHEEIVIKDLSGTSLHPFVVQGYMEERPIIDGTVTVKNISQWKKHGNIYSANISQTIWQLFLNDTMMTNARWPNAKWSDKTIFDGKRWPTFSKESTKGYVMTAGNRLKDTKMNMNGAMAILNIGSFETFVAKVYGHSAGKNDFYFNDTFGDYHFKYDRSRYFLEDKLELLDAPEEWFFNKTTKTLYVYPPQGTHPSKFTIRGKVQSYAFRLENCEHFVFRNLDFVGTAIKADVTSKIKKTSDILFDSLNFKYHTYSKRMLGDISLIDWLDIDGVYSRNKPDTWGNFTFYNNTFYGSDGLALSYHGRNVTIQNNLFEYNDWTGANMIKAGGGLATIKSFSIFDRFERNTLRYNGASVGIRPGRRPVVRLNDISKQCWGIIQNDGAGVQLTIKPQVNSTLEMNWVHDQPKYGLRFDGEPPNIGTYGTMKNNVVFRCNGLMVKGDYHTANQNTVFEKVNNKDDDKQGTGCALCVLKYVRTNPVPINNHTVVCQNLADVANGGKIIGSKGAVYDIQAEVKINNVFGHSLANELMDSRNNDFRPQRKSQAAKKQAGAYKYDSKMENYWIPGRQSYKASSPVPPDNSTTVRAATRDALMWLPGLNCNRHRVYFAEIDPKAEKESTSPDFVFLGTTIGEANVVYLKARLKRGITYKWRVDELCKGNKKYKGDVWTFTTV